MLLSLAGFFDEASAHIDASLATPAALARVRKVLNALPAALSDWIYLEFWLSPHAPRVDVIVRVDRAHRHVLTRPDFPIESSNTADVQTRWQAVRSFAAAWIDPRMGWEAAIDSMWLEFDLGAWHSDTRAGTVGPRLFIDLSRTLRRTRNAELWRCFACDIIHSVAPEVAPGEISTQLKSCLDPLPRSASPLSLEIPHGTGAKDLRICLIGIHAGDLLSYVRAIGWRDDSGALLKVLHDLRGTPGQAANVDILDVDLGHMSPGRLGLEFNFARRPQLRGMLAKEGLLAGLVDLGLAESATIAGLRAWPGCSVQSLPHTLWPCLVTRRLNHVKLTFDRDGVIAAKAYSCFFHRFSHRTRLHRWTNPALDDVGGSVADVCEGIRASAPDI